MAGDRSNFRTKLLVRWAGHAPRGTTQGLDLALELIGEPPRLVEIFVGKNIRVSKFDLQVPDIALKPFDQI